MGHYLAIKIEHANGSDVNGNTRHGWLVYERPDAAHRTGPCLAFIDADGRTDRSALAEVYGPDVDVVCVLSVPGAEWQRAKRLQRERDVPHLKAHGSGCDCYRFDVEWETREVVRGV